MSADLLSAAHLAGRRYFVGVCNNNGRLQLSAPKGLRWFVGGPVDDMPDLDTWPLDAPVERAGGVGRSERLQRAMTAQVEQHERDLLHDDIMALPVDDPRREAWLAVDRLSSQWVSSWPGLDTPLQPALGDAEFGEVVTTYLGMESPALRGLAGRSIPCGHRRHTVCDAHGFQLGLATLPGAVHTLVHNGCSFELWRMMREAGVYCEVEPRHLFNTLLPAAYLLQPGPRPSIVPDARMDVALPPPATTRQQSPPIQGCRSLRLSWSGGTKKYSGHALRTVES